MTHTLGKLAGAIAILLMLYGLCFGVFVGAKTGTVFHTTTCRYATTATAYSWATYEMATAFGRVPCKTCKPQPTPVVFDINTPCSGRDVNELSLSVNKHIVEAEKLLPTYSNKRELLERILMWQCWRLKYIAGEPNSTPIHLTQGYNQIIMSWNNDANKP